MYSTLLSVIIAIGLIIHEIFFDLDLPQIRRLTISGSVITFLIVFPLLLITERLFDIDNKYEIEKLKKEIEKLKK